MKIYLSRSTTRSMMADYPIGDPTGGPAYGEKRDPISAAVSIYTMFSAAEAGFAAMTLMEGISFAGGAIGLIGNITGNKTLSQIGMIAGIAGGIGAFAEKANLFSSGKLVDALGINGGSPVSLASVFEEGAENAAMMNVGSVPNGSGVTNPLNVNGVPAPRIDPQALQAGAPAAPVEVPQAGSADVDLSARTSPYRMRTGGGNAAAPVTLANNTATAAPASVLNPVGDGGFTAQSSTGLRVLPGDPTAATKPTFMDSLKLGNFGDAASAAGSGAMDMLKDNPTGAYVASKAIGAGVDYLSGKTDAELDKLKADTGYYNAKALETQVAIDREKARRANINASYANVNAGIKVRPPGLVASAMQST